MDDERRRPSAWMVIGLLAVTLVAGFASHRVLTEDASERFCEAALHITDVDFALEGQDRFTHTVALEDQGGPGRDGCDGGDGTGVGTPGYLGFDCHLHGNPLAPSGPITTPNRPDGTCGQEPVGP